MGHLSSPQEDFGLLPSARAPYFWPFKQIGGKDRWAERELLFQNGKMVRGGIRDMDRGWLRVNGWGDARGEMSHCPI